MKLYLSFKLKLRFVTYRRLLPVSVMTQVHVLLVLYMGARPLVVSGLPARRAESCEAGEMASRQSHVQLLAVTCICWTSL